MALSASRPNRALAVEVVGVDAVQHHLVHLWSVCAAQSGDSIRAQRRIFLDNALWSR